MIANESSLTTTIWNAKVLMSFDEFCDATLTGTTTHTDTLSVGI